MKTILHVDDSETMRQMIRMCLGAKYKVMFANNGQEACEVFEKEKIDLIITDINMPVMNGIELIKNIRLTNKEICIMTLTTESDDDIRTKGYNAGANGWICKPFKPTTLVEIVNKIFE